MSSPSPPPPLNGFGMLGIYEVGADVSFILFGVLALQIFFYFEHYTNDRRRIQFMVGGIWIVEVAHTIFTAHSLYHLTVSPGEGDGSSGISIPWSTDLAVLCSFIIDLGFESYYAYRIKIVSQRWLFPVICWFLATARFGCNIAAVGIALRQGAGVVLAEYLYLFRIPLLVGLILNLVIAGVLSYYIFLGGGGTPRSEPTLRRCLRFSIESGLVTCLFMFIMVVTSWIPRQNLIWIAMHPIITKTNSNSILVTLNSRVTVNADMYSSTGPNARSHFRNLNFLRMPVRDIAVAKSQVTETTGSEAYNDRGSLTSQFDANEICLVEIRRDGMPKGVA